MVLDDGEIPTARLSGDQSSGVLSAAGRAMPSPCYRRGQRSPRGQHLGGAGIGVSVTGGRRLGTGSGLPCAGKSRGIGATKAKAVGHHPLQTGVVDAFLNTRPLAPSSSCSMLAEAATKSSRIISNE